MWGETTEFFTFIMEEKYGFKNLFRCEALKRENKIRDLLYF